MMSKGMVTKIEMARKDIVRKRNMLENAYSGSGSGKWTLMQAVLALTNSIVMLDAFLSEQAKKTKGI